MVIRFILFCNSEGGQIHNAQLCTNNKRPACLQNAQSFSPNQLDDIAFLVFQESSVHDDAAVLRHYNAG